MKSRSGRKAYHAPAPITTRTTKTIANFFDMIKSPFQNSFELTQFNRMDSRTHPRTGLVFNVSSISARCGYRLTDRVDNLLRLFVGAGPESLQRITRQTRAR